MNNQIDMPIIHTAICFWAEQIALDGRKKSPVRIFIRLFTTTLLRNEDFYERYRPK